MKKHRRKSLKVLVTGGAGFIGSHLCENLLARGNRVWCVDNFITGRRRNIESFVGNKRFTFVKHDITEKLPNQLLEVFSSLSFLYHLASPASPPAYRKHAVETLMVNSLGTYRMLELAKKNPVPGFCSPRHRKCMEIQKNILRQKSIGEM